MIFIQSLLACSFSVFPIMWWMVYHDANGWNGKPEKVTKAGNDWKAYQGFTNHNLQWQ